MYIYRCLSTLRTPSTHHPTNTPNNPNNPNSPVVEGGTQTEEQICIVAGAGDGHVFAFSGPTENLFTRKFKKITGKGKVYYCITGSLSLMRPKAMQLPNNPNNPSSALSSSSSSSSLHHHPERSLSNSDPSLPGSSIGLTVDISNGYPLAAVQSNKAHVSVMKTRMEQRERLTKPLSVQIILSLSLSLSFSLSLRITLKSVLVHE